VGLSLAWPGGGPSHFGGGRPFFSRNSSSICANSTTAQSYLTQILALINNLQANASCNAVLQLQDPNFVSYLNNATNQALISSNCTAFVIGLKNATWADKTAQRTQLQLAFNIQQQIRQVASNVIGRNRPNDLDSSSEQHEPHF
jgi:hypothetical protein